LENKVKWGVIGSGGIARRRTIPEGIIPSEHSQLISVYDIDQEVNTSVAEEYNVTPAGSVEELLNSGLEAVYVASPVNLHLEHVTRCAKTGKHVLCEKPLGLTVGEAEEIVRISNEDGITLGTGFMMRFLAQHQAALKLIKEGKLGKPVYGRAQLSCWYPSIEGAWRQDPVTGGGGSLMDMGSHCIDLLEMFFGQIKSVSCFINNSIHSYKSEDSAIVALFFENGAMATIDTFFCIPDKSSKSILELYGSKGSILAKGTIGQGISGEMTAFLEEEKPGYNSKQTRSHSEGLSINPVPVNTYQAEIDEFSLAIIEKRDPANNFTIGIRNQKILSACYKSADSRKVIDIK
jgi:predicted dehydrogenase